MGESEEGRLLPDGLEGLAKGLKGLKYGPSPRVSHTKCLEGPDFLWGRKPLNTPSKVLQKG